MSPDHRFGLYALAAQQTARKYFEHFFCRDSRGAFHYLGRFANLVYEEESGHFNEVDLAAPPDVIDTTSISYALRGCRFVRQ